MKLYINKCTNVHSFILIQTIHVVWMSISVTYNLRLHVFWSQCACAFVTQQAEWEVYNESSRESHLNSALNTSQGPDPDLSTRRWCGSSRAHLWWLTNACLMIPIHTTASLWTMDIYIVHRSTAYVACLDITSDHIDLKVYSCFKDRPHGATLGQVHYSYPWW